MKVGVSFYYVGDLSEAIKAYSKLLGINPFYADEDWAGFHVEGGDLAIHLDSGLRRVATTAPVKYGAIISLSVEMIDDFLAAAQKAGFILVGEVQDMPYGKQAQIRDPWGNRLSILESNSNSTAVA